MEYTLNKYAVIEYTQTGVQLVDRVLLTPETDRDTVVQARIAEIRAGSEASYFTVSEAYEYAEVFEDQSVVVDITPPDVVEETPTEGV